MSKRMKIRVTRLWRNWVKPLGIVLIVCGSFRSAVADWNDVPTGSMKPTIVEGDRIFVNKLAYGLRAPMTSWWLAEWGGPERGDVVVFFSPDGGERMVKRVIGVPGDQILMLRNRLFVNGEPVQYGPIDDGIKAALSDEELQRSRLIAEKLDGRWHAMMTIPGRVGKRTFGPITVPEGHYFVMGDNRDNSRDSRWFGCVERSAIVGRATSVLLSVDPSRHYMPRWSRFFQDLL